MKIGKIKDKVLNVTFNVWNCIQYYVFRIRAGNFNFPKDIGLAYSEDFVRMTNVDFDKKYIRRQLWGDYHPADLQQWYDPQAVIIKGGLNLCVTENTKEVTSYNVNGVQQNNLFPAVIPNGVGLVTSIKSYEYGIFVWNILLPTGAGLWPAVWMSGRDSWPPEIDVLEGYSEKNGKYGKSLNTNIHCGSSNETHYGIGANRHGLFVDKDEILNLICDWNKDRIKIYYNGFLCRIVTNKDDMKWFESQNMRIILNQGLRKEIMHDLPFDRINVAPMVIKDFSYYTIKKGA